MSGNDNTYPKIATFTRLCCNTLSSTNLSAHDCKIDSLQAALSGSTYVFSAGNTGITAEAITASNLYAGLNNSNYKLQVLANSDPIEISRLAAANLSAGISSDTQGDTDILLKALDNSEELVLKKLRVTESAGLTANGISELTAKAACWS